MKYEIEKIIAIGNGLFGGDISKVNGLQGNATERCGELPNSDPFYYWNRDKGYENMGAWIEKAARDAGR